MKSIGLPLASLTAPTPFGSRPRYHPPLAFVPIRRYRRCKASEHTMNRKQKRYLQSAKMYKMSKLDGPQEQKLTSSNKSINSILHRDSMCKLHVAQIPASPESMENRVRKCSGSPFRGTLHCFFPPLDFLKLRVSPWSVLCFLLVSAMFVSGYQLEEKRYSK